MAESENNERLRLTQRLLAEEYDKMERANVSL